MPNKIEYGIKLVSNKVYNLVIDGITIVESLFERITISSLISASPTLGIFLARTISMVQSINASSSALMGVFLNFVDDLEMQIQQINELRRVSNDPLNFIVLSIYVYAVNALYRTSSDLTGVFSLVASETLAVLIKLEVYDPQDLGDLDTMTLGEMDSVIL